MKNKSSEERLNLPTQPSNTCPMIDSVLESIEGIGDYDEDDNPIDISPDFSSLNDAMSNADEIAAWGFAWLDMAEEHLEDRLTDIIQSIEDEKEDEYTEMYGNVDQHEYIEYVLESVGNSIKEGRKDIQRIVKDLEWIKSSVESLISDNSHSANSELESFRTTVTDLRDTCNHYKQEVKEYILEFLPELAGQPTAYETFIENKNKVENFLIKKQEENNPKKAKSLSFK